MGFRKGFLWGGATAANQCEGGANEGNRGVANVDLMPLGEDRYLVGTGKMKMRLSTIVSCTITSDMKIYRGVK